LIATASKNLAVSLSKIRFLNELTGIPSYLITSSIQMSQEFSIDEILRIVNN